MMAESRLDSADSKTNRPLYISGDTTKFGRQEIYERLSMSLMNLKLQNRNEINEEIHGVRSLAREETPELVNSSLHRMNAELYAIVSSSRWNQHAFQKAQNLRKTFVNDRDFRLKFLRCELFDPIKAADRMLVYLDYVQHIFGQRGLEEPLNINFFVNEEAVALREGNFQLLPFRDRSGRRVLVILWGAMSYTPLLKCKLMLYFWYVMSEDAETQRKGAVCIVWGCTNDKIGSGTQTKLPGSIGYKRIIIPSGRSLDSGIPVRFVCFHMCYQDSIPMYIRAFYFFVLSESIVPRIIFHSGTKTEMRYKLLGYGIPVSYLPDTDTGVVKVKNHIQWLKVRKQLEKNLDSCTNICECPSINDVLFRRAGSCLAHPGNSLFKNLLESKKEEHDSSNQTEKRDISWSIVEEIESRNGRFFKWSTSQTCWIQITRAESRQKVAMSIRDFNRQSKAKENHQSTKSSTDVFNSKKRKNIECDTGSCIFPNIEPAHSRPSPYM